MQKLFSYRMHVQYYVTFSITRGRTESEGNVVCLKDRLLAMRTLLLRLEASVPLGGEAADSLFAAEEAEEGQGKGRVEGA